MLGDKSNDKSNNKAFVNLVEYKRQYQDLYRGVSMFTKDKPYMKDSPNNIFAIS